MKASMKDCNAYSFDGTKATKLPFEIFDFRVITQAANKQSLESISTDLRIIGRHVCRCWLAWTICE